METELRPGYSGAARRKGRPQTKRTKCHRATPLLYPRNPICLSPPAMKPRLNLTVCRQRRSHRAFALCLFYFSANVAAQSQEPPEYLKHRLDPIQQIYSKAIFGFALEKKCNFLTSSGKEKYERDLNLATQIFNGYVVAKGYISSRNYVNELIVGSIKFTVTLPCDSTGRESIESGAETAEKFMQLVRPFLNEPTTK